MAFPRLDITQETIPTLTIVQKQGIVDGFCTNESPVSIKHAYNLPKTRVKELYDKLMEFYRHVLNLMDADPTQTATTLQEAMYALYPGQQQGIVDYILTKIVETTTEEGTWATFRACFPRE